MPAPAHPLALYSSLSSKREPPRVIAAVGALAARMCVRPQGDASLDAKIGVLNYDKHCFSVYRNSCTPILRLKTQRQMFSRRAYIRSTHDSPSRNAWMLFAWIHGSCWSHSALMSIVTTMGTRHSQTSYE